MSGISHHIKFVIEPFYSLYLMMYSIKFGSVTFQPKFVFTYKNGRATISLLCRSYYITALIFRLFFS